MRRKTQPSNGPSIHSVRRLQQKLVDGIATAHGKRYLEARVGVEIEFIAIPPAILRRQIEVAQSRRNSAALRNLRNHIINPSAIELADNISDAHIPDFRKYVGEFLQMLPLSSPESESRRQELLGQVDRLDVHDLINFLLYEEFSVPQILRPQMSGGSLKEVDEFTRTQGWVEWRIGKDKYQKGYYDNEGTSELRINPCTPVEAVERTKTVMAKLAEIGSDLGLAIWAGPDTMHINLSLHEERFHSWKPLIGNSQDTVSDTLDIVSGVMAAYHDGIFITPYLAKINKWLFASSSQWAIEVGPFRQKVRVVTEKLELRSDFESLEHGIAWLLAGSIAGLGLGRVMLQKQGYEVAQVSDVYKVKRLQNFDKMTDLRVQRAMEMASERDGKFQLDEGCAYIKGKEICDAFFGKERYVSERDDLLAQVVVDAVKVHQDGTPHVDPESLEKARKELYQRQGVNFPFSPSLEGELDRLMHEYNFSGDKLPLLVEQLNNRLCVINMRPTKAVTGKGRCQFKGRSDALRKMSDSMILKLAYGKELPPFMKQVARSSRVHYQRPDCLRHLRSRRPNRFDVRAA